MKTRSMLKQWSMSAVAALGIGLVASSAYATELCHNIGGPNGLGANTDCPLTTPDPGCVIALEGGGTITVAPGFFLGIHIGQPGQPPFNQPPINIFVNPVAAHIAHGDGVSVFTFSPPLHLASSIGPHQASNVECLAERIVPQPTEPGN